MNACNKCLENNWEYRVLDGWILATCNLCGFEVEFEQKKKKELNGICRKCDSQLGYVEASEKQIAKKKKRCFKGKTKYYYTAWFKCFGCGQIYHDNKSKVFKKNIRYEKTNDEK